MTKMRGHTSSSKPYLVPSGSEPHTEREKLAIETIRRMRHSPPSNFNVLSSIRSMAAFGAITLASGYAFLKSPKVLVNYECDRRGLQLAEECVMYRIRANDKPKRHRAKDEHHERGKRHGRTHSTGPSSFNFAFVSVSGVVEANSQTLPFRIFTAVDLSKALGHIKAYRGEESPKPSTNREKAKTSKRSNKDC